MPAFFVVGRPLTNEFVIQPLIPRHPPSLSSNGATPGTKHENPNTEKNIHSRSPARLISGMYDRRERRGTDT